MMEKEYVGDGVYINVGDFHGQIVLTTENGICVENRIFLELEMIETISSYAARSMKED